MQKDGRFKSNLLQRREAEALRARWAELLGEAGGTFGRGAILGGTPRPALRPSTALKRQKRGPGVPH